MANTAITKPVAANAVATDCLIVVLEGTWRVPPLISATLSSILGRAVMFLLAALFVARLLFLAEKSI